MHTSKLFQHNVFGHMVTLVQDKDGWVEFWDPSYNELRYLESKVFYQAHIPADMFSLRAQAKLKNVLVPKELD